MFIGTTVNESAVIAGVLGEKIIGEPSFIAVKFNSEGSLVKAGAGENAVGIIIPGTVEDPAKGTEVTVQVTGMGVARAGAVIKKGDNVAVGTDGRLIKATATNFIVGVALTGAAENGTFTLQITKSGYEK